MLNNYKKSLQFRTIKLFSQKKYFFVHNLKKNTPTRFALIQKLSVRARFSDIKFQFYSFLRAKKNMRACKHFVLNSQKKKNDTRMDDFLLSAPYYAFENCEVPYKIFEKTESK